MLRLVSILAAAAALASCSSPITEADCTKAAESGTWDVTFAKSSGPATCPVLEDKSLALPNACEVNCGCTEARIVFEASPNTATPDKCSLRFDEVCPGYELDCRYVTVDGSNHASGDCFYKIGTDSCGYKVEWTKQ